MLHEKTGHTVIAGKPRASRYLLSDQTNLLCFAKACLSKKAGLLAYNISTALPIQLPGQWALLVKIFLLFTVARQPVIFARFPINFNLSKTLLVV
jgi:hypothetical protein